MAFAGADAVCVFGGWRDAFGANREQRFAPGGEGGAAGALECGARRSRFAAVAAAGLVAAGLGEGLVDELEELAAVDDLDEGRGVSGVGDDPDGGGVLDADALAEGVVGFDFLGEAAHGIDGEGQSDAVGGGEALREVLELAGGFDGDLVGEDLVAIVVAEGFAFGVEEAGVDGGLEAPGVLGEREVVADPGDVVLCGGLFEEGVGLGAVGALHVFELDDGDACAGRRLEGGGVVDLGGGRRAELGAGGDGEQRGEGQGRVRPRPPGRREGKRRLRKRCIAFGRLPKSIVTGGMGTAGNRE